LALGAALLAVYFLALLVWLNLGHSVLEFLRVHGILEWTVLCLRSLAPTALLAGVLLLAPVLPRLSPKFPGARAVVLALAFLYAASMFFEIIHYSHFDWAYQFWKSHPLLLGILGECLDITGTFTFVFLCIAGIGFMTHVARYARAPWIAVAALLPLAASSLCQLVETLDAMSVVYQIPTRMSPYWGRIEKADQLLQLTFWLLIAVWATIRWRAARRTAPC
jgi:hypothetical protein